MLKNDEVNRGVVGNSSRLVVGYEERTTRRTKFYFQLFATPINYNIIRKLTLRPQFGPKRGILLYPGNS